MGSARYTLRAASSFGERVDIIARQFVALSK